MEAAHRAAVEEEEARRRAAAAEAEAAAAAEARRQRCGPQAVLRRHLYESTSHISPVCMTYLSLVAVSFYCRDLHCGRFTPVCVRPSRNIRSAAISPAICPARVVSDLVTRLRIGSLLTVLHASCVRKSQQPTVDCRNAALHVLWAPFRDVAEEERRAAAARQKAAAETVAAEAAQRRLAAEAEAAERRRLADEAAASAKAERDAAEAAKAEEEARQRQVSPGPPLNAYDPHFCGGLSLQLSFLTDKSLAHELGWQAVRRQDDTALRMSCLPDF